MTGHGTAGRIDRRLYNSRVFTTLLFVPPRQTPPLLPRMQRLSDEEMEVIEKSGGEAECLAGGFQADLLHQMYARGLVYFDVPVYPTDRFRGKGRG